ncbi:MAG: MurR/RpiR family transcriptional regulator [Burkholderiaceae bacterium]|jgi:DNA-binding MurR/RpiR family transcriptional regulator
MKLFDRIANYPKKLTKHEKKLTDYILAGYPQHLLESATSIANKLGISASTVVRFFSKLNYSSLTEVQDEARLELASKLTSPLQRASLAARNAHSIPDIVERTFALDRDNISATSQSIDMRSFEAVVDALASHDTRRIYIAGAKNSLAIVHYLHTHLNMCLPNVHALTTEATYPDQLLWADSTDLVLAVTIRRYSRSVVQAVRYFDALGAKVACITDSPLSPIANLSDHRLLVHTSSLSPFDSYTAAFSLCNALVAAVSRRRQKEVTKSLVRGDKLWRQFGVFVADDGAKEN